MDGDPIWGYKLIMSLFLCVCGAPLLNRQSSCQVNINKELKDNNSRKGIKLLLSHSDGNENRFLFSASDSDATKYTR